MANILIQLSTSLKADRSDTNIRRWGRYVIDNNIALESLLPILGHEKRVATGFIWMVGGICELAPTVVLPCVSRFYAMRHEVPIVNYDRSLAKMFWLAGVPAEIEGEVIDQLFKWLLGSNITVTTKNYSMFALYKLCGQYPELKNELKITLEDQLDKNTADFKKRGMKMLEEL